MFVAYRSVNILSSAKADTVMPSMMDKCLNSELSELLIKPF